MPDPDWTDLENCIDLEHCIELLFIIFILH